MTVQKLKEKVINSLGEIEIDKLSLSELKEFATIFEIIDKINTKSYFDKISERITDSACSYKPTPISSFKEE